MLNTEVEDNVEGSDIMDEDNCDVDSLFKTVDDWLG
jgi:hypothetical protein